MLSQIREYGFPKHTHESSRNRTAWLCRHLSSKTFSKRLSFLINEVGFDIFWPHAELGIGISRDRLKAICSSSRKNVSMQTLSNKRIEFIEPQTLYLIHKALCDSTNGFIASYELILESTHSTGLCPGSLDLYCNLYPVAQGAENFGVRLSQLRQLKGHAYKGSFVKSLPTITESRYTRIESGRKRTARKEPVCSLRPSEFVELKRALNCSYELLIEGIPSIRC